MDASKVACGKVEFRLRQDYAESKKRKWVSGWPFFQHVWLAGFKACLDFLVVELRAVDQHQAADILQEVRKTWPS